MCCVLQFTKPVVLETYTLFLDNWKSARKAIKTTCQAKPAFARFLEVLSLQFFLFFVLSSLYNLTVIIKYTRLFLSHSLFLIAILIVRTILLIQFNLLLWSSVSLSSIYRIESLETRYIFDILGNLGLGMRIVNHFKH